MGARVFSYERVSSVKQAQRGSGLDRQAEAAAAWCHAHRLELDETLTLSDSGRSAFKGEHLGGALGEFLRLAEAGQLGEDPILLVEAIDRLSRLEPVDGLQEVLLALVRSGVRLITLEDGAEYSRATLRSDPSKLLVLTVKAQSAHEYSQRLSRRIIDSWERERAKLRSGTLTRVGTLLPAWCDLQDDGRAVLNDYADVARHALLLLRDHGENTTARLLNQQGSRSPGGKAWTRAAVTSLLRDDRVWGAVTLHSPRGSSKRTSGLRQRGLHPETIEGLLPALLSRDDIEGIRSLVSARAGHTGLRGPNNKILWIAQGATTCSCGTTCGTRTRKGRDGVTYRYIRCRHSLSHGDGCRGLSYPLPALTAHVLTRLRDGQIRQLLADADDRDARTAADRAELQRLVMELARAEQAEANAGRLLKDALKAGSADPLFLEAVEEARAEAARLRAETGAVRARLAQTVDDGGEELSAVSVALLQSFSKGEDTAEQRRAVNVGLKRMGVRVLLDPDAQRVGLAVGDGLPRYQPLAAGLAQKALEEGKAGTTYMHSFITLEEVERVKEEFERLGPEALVEARVDFWGQPDFDIPPEGVQLEGRVGLKGSSKTHETCVGLKPNRD
ncbi:MAG: recombinase family protein [Cyanobacteriota bacterium]